MDISGLLVLITAAITAIIVKTFYDNGKKALSIFPDIKSVNVKYSDKTATGYSTQSWKTKVGGASRSIHIVVTEGELWLKSFLLLAGITKQHDLLHKISLNKIIKAKENGELITLDFRNDKGDKKQVVVRTRDKAEFLKSIGK